MTLYTMAQALAGRDIYRATSGNYSAFTFALECEGTNGQSYATSSPPFGTNDIADTLTGNVTISGGTYSLTTSRSNLGTSSLVVPTTNSYMRQTTSESGWFALGATLATWIYFDALPSGSNCTPLYWSSNSSRPATISNVSSGFNLGVQPDGKVISGRRYLSTDETLVSTTALTAGAWHFIAATWFGHRCYFNINGTIEIAAGSETFPLTDGSQTMYSMIVGNTGGNTGVYLDDVKVCHRPRTSYATSGYVPGAYESETDMYSLFPLITTPGNWNNTASLTSIYQNFPAYEYESAILQSSLSVAISPQGSVLNTLLGVAFTGNILEQNRGGGGAGCTRPTTGVLYPRGEGLIVP